MYYPPSMMPPFDPQYASTPGVEIAPISNPRVSTKSSIPMSSNTAYASSMKTVRTQENLILNPDVSMCTPQSAILPTKSLSEVTNLATQFEEVSGVDTKDNIRKVSSNATVSSSREPVTKNSDSSSRFIAHDKTESCKKKNSSKSDSTANCETDSSSSRKLSTQKSNFSSGETAKPKTDLQIPLDPSVPSNPSIRAKCLPKDQNSPDLPHKLKCAYTNEISKTQVDSNKQKISATCRKTGLKIDISFDKPTPPASTNIPTSELSTSNKPKTVAVAPNTVVSIDESMKTDSESHVADLDARPHFIKVVNNLSCYYESQYAASLPLLTANQFQKNQTPVWRDEHSFYKDMASPAHMIDENQLPLTSEFGHMVSFEQ